MKKAMILTKDHPVTEVTLSLPTDVLEDMERVAESKEMSGWKSLLKLYISQGLRKDLEDEFERKRDEEKLLGVSGETSKESVSKTQKRTDKSDTLEDWFIEIGK
jgi:hypothetical protein